MAIGHCGNGRGRMNTVPGVRPAATMPGTAPDAPAGSLQCHVPIVVGIARLLLQQRADFGLPLARSVNLNFWRYAS